ncbi:MAG: ferrochelatase-domain-containing protein [Monoraphidium minutum]|nr:MAG: ferrochelatase-domain-containing protein [Monoraphidium minutum]
MHVAPQSRIASLGEARRSTLSPRPSLPSDVCSTSPRCEAVSLTTRPRGRALRAALRGGDAVVARAIAAPARTAAAPPPPPPPPAAPHGKAGVLLLNLGGPDTLDDVRPFLFNLFSDEAIIRLPPPLRFLQPVIAYIIAALRAPKSAEGYAAIGGGSPLRAVTEEQADHLRRALRRKGLAGAEVYVGMRYWQPSAEEALQQAVADGVTRLVVLPLYPQYSISTTGSSLDQVSRLLADRPALAGLETAVIPSWYARPGYVSAMAGLIEEQLDEFDDPGQVRVFFSAHGVPRSYVEEAGDPYREQMEECISLITAELSRRGRPNPHTLAYQSRVGPVEWLRPYTDDAIRELGRGGCDSLLAVPVSFVSDHIETLEEMDMEYRELALESGVRQWRRVPALGTDPAFIDDLAEAVLEALPSAVSAATPAGAARAGSAARAAA